LAYTCLQFTIGDTATPSAAYSTPASSNCQTYSTISNGTLPSYHRPLELVVPRLESIFFFFMSGVTELAATAAATVSSGGMRSSIAASGSCQPIVSRSSCVLSEADDFLLYAVSPLIFCRCLCVYHSKGDWRIGLQRCFSVSLSSISSQSSPCSASLRRKLTASLPTRLDCDRSSSSDTSDASRTAVGSFPIIASVVSLAVGLLAGGAVLL
jgi:hypothetical protein